MYICVYIYIYIGVCMYLEGQNRQSFCDTKGLSGFNVAIMLCSKSIMML